MNTIYVLPDPSEKFQEIPNLTYMRGRNRERASEVDILGGKSKEDYNH